MAHTLRGEVPDGVVVHADRGTEFPSDDMFKVCRGLERWCTQSGGRVCVGTLRWLQSVWATLKTSVLRPE